MIAVNKQSANGISCCRHEGAVKVLQGQLNVHQMTANEVQHQVVLKEQELAAARWVCQATSI